MDWILKPLLVFGIVYIPSSTAWAVTTTFNSGPQVAAITAAIAFLFAVGLVITTKFSEN
jgi:hypothetical protein